MSDTPRTDAEAMNGAFKDQGCTITLQQWDYYKTTDGEVVMVEFARQLERENNELRQALSGRTVSCSNCNALAAENALLRDALSKAERLIFGSHGAVFLPGQMQAYNLAVSKIQPQIK